MREIEKNYAFRKKMLQIHQADLRNTSLLPDKDEFEITDGFVVDISKASGEVTLTAARDFQDYLLISMGVSVLLTQKPLDKQNHILYVKIVGKDKKLGLGNGYMGFKLSFDENITISAFDERGVAQAFYYLEDLMTLRKAPYIKRRTVERKPMFSPRMVHSGYGLDQFPDSHLRNIAHAGMDAIMVFTEAPNLTPCGFLDFNELIFRASKYGIDVYAYSYLKSEKHPDDAGAEAYYDSTYGNLFASCPGLKGVILVGESVAFPSHDLNTSGTIEGTSFDGIPNTKIHPGWWPCEDYPAWLELLKKVIYKHNEKADIVFWSYNWGWAPEENRVKLIHSLPKDISLLVTYEMHEVYEEDGIKERTSDYTLSKALPGKYFLSEAKAAKERGVRLYAMTNTAGLTWDFGMIPYEPFPKQWKKRYDSMIACREQYGLCGLMESHHYGFYPSFISEFAKWNFIEDSEKTESILLEIFSSYFGEENAQVVDEALNLWSEGIRYYHAVAADQYGAFRIGPAYPICLNRRLVPPSASYAHFGARIVEPKYDPFVWLDYSETSVPQIRIHYEIKQLQIMDEYLQKGISILEAIDCKNDALEELLDLGKYICCSVRTALHSKEFVVAKAKLDASESPKEMERFINTMESIAIEEIENAKSAIPLVQKNSRLGWEPSMEYLGDETHILWKIRQVEYMLENELKILKEGIKHNL
ncbi:MAG: hypothetical protein II997_01035 [Clostridia bacterium]|nr:hypothetical protein [Clostridia bacterium]